MPSCIHTQKYKSHQKPPVVPDSFPVSTAFFSSALSTHVLHDFLYTRILSSIPICQVSLSLFEKSQGLQVNRRWKRCMWVSGHAVTSQNQDRTKLIMALTNKHNEEDKERENDMDSFDSEDLDKQSGLDRTPNGNQHYFKSDVQEQTFLFSQRSLRFDYGRSKGYIPGRGPFTRRSKRSFSSTRTPSKRIPNFGDRQSKDHESVTHGAGSGYDPNDESRVHSPEHSKLNGNDDSHRNSARVLRMRGRMRFFLCVGSSQDLKQWLPTGLFYGVVIQPKVLAENRSPCTVDHVVELINVAMLLGTAEVHVQVWGSSAVIMEVIATRIAIRVEKLQEKFHENEENEESEVDPNPNGRFLSKIRDNVKNVKMSWAKKQSLKRDGKKLTPGGILVVHFPMTVEGCQAAGRVAMNGTQVAFTGVTTADQAWIGASLGAKYTAIHLTRQKETKDAKVGCDDQDMSKNVDAINMAQRENYLKLGQIIQNLFDALGSLTYVMVDVISMDEIKHYMSDNPTSVYMLRIPVVNELFGSFLTNEAEPEGNTKTA